MLHFNVNHFQTLLSFGTLRTRLMFVGKVFSNVNKQPSLEWCCANWKRKILAESGRWVSNIKISILLKRVDSLMSEYPWNEKNNTFKWLSSLYNPFKTTQILAHFIKNKFSFPKICKKYSDPIRSMMLNLWCKQASNIPLPFPDAHTYSHTHTYTRVHVCKIYKQKLYLKCYFVRNKITQIRIITISIGRGVVIEKLSKFVWSILWFSQYSFLVFQF